MQTQIFDFKMRNTSRKGQNYPLDAEASRPTLSTEHNFREQSNVISLCEKRQGLLT